MLSSSNISDIFLVLAGAPKDAAKIGQTRNNRAIGGYIGVDVCNLRFELIFLMGKYILRDIISIIYSKGIKKVY